MPGAASLRALQRLGPEGTEQQRRPRVAPQPQAGRAHGVPGGVFEPRRRLDLDIERKAVALHVARHRVQAGQRLAGKGA